MKTTKVTSFLERQAEINRQLMVLGAVLFVTGLMSVGIMQMTQAATTGTTTVDLTVTSGSLAIDQVPATFTFASGAPGDTVSGNTGATDGNAVKTNDTTGSSSAYSVTGFFNGVFTDGSNTSAITSQMTWYASTIAIQNVTGTSGELAAGTDQTFSGTGAGNSKTLATAAAGAPGAFNIYNLKMNYAIPISTVASSYSTDLVLTIA